MAYYNFILNLESEGLDDTTINLAYDVMSAASVLYTELAGLKSTVDRSLKQLKAGAKPGMGVYVVHPVAPADIAIASIKLEAAQNALLKHDYQNGWDLIERCIAAAAQED